MTTPGVVIYGEGRCGSTLLVSLLDSIDDFRCDGEVLQERVASPRVLLNDLRRQTCEQIYGCKILRYHIRAIHGIEDSDQFLLNLINDGFKIILLERQNTLRTAISNVYARQGKFHYTTSDNHLSENAKVHIDIDAVLDWTRRLEGGRFRDAITRSRVPFALILQYETDLRDQSVLTRTAKRVCDLFDFTPSFLTQPKLVKSTHKRLDGFLVNHAELKDAVAKTKFRCYLDTVDEG